MTPKLTRGLLAATILMTGMGVAVPETAVAAGSVQLHELLFNRKKQKQVEQRNTVQPRVLKPQSSTKKPANVEKAPAPSKPIQKVAGPQYYTYKVAALAAVSIQSLLPDVQSTGAVASQADGLPPLQVLEQNRFREAMAHVPEAQLKAEDEIIESIRAYYADKQDFVWFNGMSLKPEATTIIDLMKKADAHGLDPADYAVEPVAVGWSMDNPAARYKEMIAFDALMTARVLRYAMDMKDGMISPNKLSGYHDFSGTRLTAAKALEALTASADRAGYLKGLEPQQNHYLALQQELAALKKETDEAIVIPEGTFVRPGSVTDALPTIMAAVRKAVTPELAEKHASALSGYSGTTLYDGALVDLVRDVQKSLNLSPDGVVGPNTVRRLSGESVESKIEKVKLTMERYRWHPETYGEKQVVINVPEFRVRYMENSETKLAMNTVVGTKDNQTYFFYDEIETVVFNPYWGVPQSIIVNEMLPRLRRDPGYLDRNGYVVSGGNGKTISSSAINWSQYSSRVPYSVRQKPGPSNALGELKILFPNKHAIYMHDTPAKSLFSRDSRAFSHGCVRLEDPRAMAAAVMGKSKDWVASQLTGTEDARRIEKKIPIFIGYFTAFPDDDGKVKYSADVYERDMYLRRAIDTLEESRKG